MITRHYTITCDKCGHEEKYKAGEMTSSTEFTNENGWKRVTIYLHGSSTASPMDSSDVCKECVEDLQSWIARKVKKGKAK